MNIAKKLWQEIKNWWQKLPHKGFVLLQLVPVLLNVMLLTLQVLSTPFYQLGQLGIFCMFFCFFIFPILAFFQLIWVGIVYGLKALMKNLVILFITIGVFVVAIFLSATADPEAQPCFIAIMPLLYVIFSLDIQQEAQPSEKGQKHGRK